MIRAKLCFVAEGIIRDADNNTISAFTLIEGLGAAGFPLFLQRLSFFALWLRDTEDPRQIGAHFRVNLGNTILNETRLRLDFIDQLKTRTVIHLQGLVVPQPGLLDFHMELEDGSNVDYSLEVTQTAPVVAPQVVAHQ